MYCFHASDLSSVHLKTYTDASLNNLPNGGSQGGTITFLCDSFNHCCPLSWSSTKIKRVVRSTLAAETLALVEGSETAMYLSELTSSCLHGKKMEISSITDNESLYDAVQSSKPLMDKRLCLEISELCEMSEREDINIFWVEGAKQLSNVLTKKRESALPLMTVLKNGQIAY